MAHNPLRRELAKLIDPMDARLDHHPDVRALAVRALAALGGPVEAQRGPIVDRVEPPVVMDTIPSDSDPALGYAQSALAPAVDDLLEKVTTILTHANPLLEAFEGHPANDPEDGIGSQRRECDARLEGWMCTQVKGHTQTPHRARMEPQGAVYAEWAVEAPTYPVTHGHDAHTVVSDEGMPEPVEPEPSETPDPVCTGPFTDAFDCPRHDPKRTRQD